MIGQRHAKRDLMTNAKRVDPDQPPRLRRRVWSGFALFDIRHINGIYISCCVNTLVTYVRFQYCKAADLGLHYVKCLKAPFRVTLAIWYLQFAGPDCLSILLHNRVHVKLIFCPEFYFGIVQIIRRVSPFILQYRVWFFFYKLRATVKKE